MTVPHGIDTEAFRHTSGFSRWLRERLRELVLPRMDPHFRATYEEQFDESSRNVEIAVEGLIKLFARHPLKALPLLRALTDWYQQYHGTQSEVSAAPRYLVYTQHDHRIPFVPQDDIVYAYMVSQLAYLANQLSEIVARKQMWSITNGFVEMNRVSKEAFRRFPTMTPRFMDHDRLTLKVVQGVDDPVNCCPSLHIAYSIYIDNVAQFTIRPLRRRRAVFDSIRFATLRMFNSVLYTKQHSLLDVAFGILCARIVFERRFDHPFDDFIDTFDELARQHPIPYAAIAEMYDEAAAIYSTRRNLADTLGEYLKRHGFITVAAGQDTVRRYFDTKTRRICIP